MVSKYTIYGERCSGTSYLEDLIEANFNVQVTWELGWKHFYLEKKCAREFPDDIFVICIVRDIVDWLNSFYEQPHHLPHHLKGNKDRFLNEEIYSVNHKNGELLDSTYSNIFEMRHEKLKYMMEYLPQVAKNTIVIRYEDLLNDFCSTMYKIKNRGLVVKSEGFPVNISWKSHKKWLWNDKTHDRGTYMKKTYNHFTREEILTSKNLNRHFEKLLYGI